MLAEGTGLVDIITVDCTDVLALVEVSVVALVDIVELAFGAVSTVDDIVVAELLDDKIFVDDTV